MIRHTSTKFAKEFKPILSTNSPNHFNNSLLILGGMTGFAAWFSYFRHNQAKMLFENSTSHRQYRKLYDDIHKNGRQRPLEFIPYRQEWRDLSNKSKTIFDPDEAPVTSKLPNKIKKENKRFKLVKVPVAPDKIPKIK